MKTPKALAAVLAGGLVSASALFAIGVAPAQAAVGTTTENIDYTCGLANGTASTITPYEDVQLKISVTPTTVAEGGSQTITFELGGDGVTGVGNSPFDNGPFVPSTSATYRVVFNASIDGGAPFNVVSTTPSDDAPAGAAVFSKGVTASISTNNANLPALTAGDHTVSVRQIIVNSQSSGPAWVTGEPTDVNANARSFDSICNGGTNQITIVGNNAPPETPPNAVPASYLTAAETEFTVSDCVEDVTPTGTSTALTAAPASPQVEGTSVKLDATVTAAACNNTPPKTLAGSVQFKSGSTNIGSPQAIADGKASVTTTTLPVGANSLTAEFTPTVTGAEGFAPSTSDALSFQITAKTTPPPPGGDGGGDDAPPSSKAESSKVTLAKVYCSTISKASQPGYPATQEYTNWPVTLTVSPGAAKPGNAVKVSVSLNGTIKNGPVQPLDPGQYRFEPSISFEGKSYKMTNGTVQPAGAGLNQPVFPKLPLTASTTINLPDEEGEFPVKLQYLNFNNVKGSTATPGMTDIFDYVCNASSNPVDSPKAFGNPTVEVLADNSAADSGVEDDPGGANGGTEEAGGVLPATGPRELIILALLGFLALQVGAVAAVRAHRSTPVRRQI